MGGDCWFVLALKLSWQTVWPNLTALLYDTSLLPAWDNILVRTELSWETIIMGITVSLLFLLSLTSHWAAVPRYARLHLLHWLD